jgi:hypothetical protein
MTAPHLLRPSVGINHIDLRYLLQRNIILIYLLDQGRTTDDEASVLAGVGLRGARRDVGGRRGCYRFSRAVLKDRAPSAPGARRWGYCRRIGEPTSSLGKCCLVAVEACVRPALFLEQKRPRGWAHRGLFD